ncbi:RNA polymerase sigma factor [Geosporobacter ferrireducens]|uniref:RNA polymerase subunit sigma-24 n=1 Tax=Geosporobacter ferrireducens TaxID=1424294 RepID=A0A1D8GID4_9FIRM|nr:RNA polymerase sigma factor [Geosporobacter ferrireducens]AOT70671.1 RNA polymerase subunit sigma-24 [Geosporobacter ferrireducens]
MMEGEKIIKAQEGDIKAIEEICSVTWEPLYRFIYYKVQNREEAEDITQETYFKAISYMQKSNIRIDKHIAFLKTVALNVLRDKWRKNKRQRINVNLETINPKDTALGDPTEAVAEREAIENALNHLNEEQRTVIDLRIIRGYSVADTAKLMDKKENYVRVLQHRALQNLTKILKNDSK